MLAVFRSTSPYLSVPGEPYKTQQLVNGQLVVVSITPTFEFKNNVLMTDKEELAEYLRNKKGWIGVFYSEQPVARKADGAPANGKPIEPEKVEGIVAKNQAIAYLVKEKGVDPATFKGISAVELKAAAVVNHHVDFVDWKP
jgi:hypothetical protein